MDKKATAALDPVAAAASFSAHLPHGGLLSRTRNTYPSPTRNSAGFFKANLAVWRCQRRSKRNWNKRLKKGKRTRSSWSVAGFKGLALTCFVRDARDWAHLAAGDDEVLTFSEVARRVHSAMRRRAKGPRHSIGKMRFRRQRSSGLVSRSAGGAIRIGASHLRQEYLSGLDSPHTA